MCYSHIDGMRYHGRANLISIMNESINRRVSRNMPRTKSEVNGVSEEDGFFM